MIDDVDETLRALIERDALSGAGVDVSFEAPTRKWAAGQNGPVVNVYLHDIREDLDRRPTQYREVRGEVGGRDVVVARTMPPRTFALGYLVSAWTQRPEDEHRLLSAILACLVRNPVVPRDMLHGTLAADGPGGEDPVPVRLAVGVPATKERSPSDLWNALGGELKPSLDVVVSAPLDPEMHQEVGPLVTEKPIVKVHDAGRPVRRARGE